MHELPATQSILEVALASAQEAGAARIEAIDIAIGDLSSMVGESVQFYFDVLSRGTAAAGAELRLRRVPGAALCGSCGVSYPVSPPLEPACRQCGSLMLRVRGGREFHIESIEVSA